MDPVKQINTYTIYSENSANLKLPALCNVFKMCKTKKIQLNIIIFISLHDIL